MSYVMCHIDFAIKSAPWKCGFSQVNWSSLNWLFIKVFFFSLKWPINSDWTIEIRASFHLRQNVVTVKVHWSNEEERCSTSAPFQFKPTSTRYLCLYSVWSINWFLFSLPRENQSSYFLIRPTFCIEWRKWKVISMYIVDIYFMIGSIAFDLFSFWCNRKCLVIFT